MNLADLSKIDVQDLAKIDYKKLLLDLKKRPDLIINFLAIILTVILCIHIYTKNTAEIKRMRSEIYQFDGKIKIVEGYKKSKDDLSKFIEDIPEHVGDDGLISLLTNFAVSRSVQIESFSPTRKKSTDFQDSISISLNISAERYKDIWFFIHDIEKSKYSVRINSWSGRPASGKGKTPANESWVNVALDITSVKIKND